MFILDSLMISGIRWALQTVATAADAEMNDDGALREQLLEAEMRREMGELSDEEFRRTEASLLARIREIRERREGGSGPLGFATLTSDDATAERVQVEASLVGDFHSASAPSASAPLALRRDRPVGPVLPTERRLRGRGIAAVTHTAVRSAKAAPSRKRKSAPQAPSAGRAGKRRR